MEIQTLFETTELFDHLPIGIILLDNEAKILYSNQNALKFLAVSKEDILDLLIPLPSIDDRIRVHLTNLNGPVSFEISINNRTLLCQLKPNSSELPGKATLILEDVTRYKSITILKSEFISSILHRLRDPLTSIKTSLSLLQHLQETFMNPDAKEIVDISLTESNRLILFLNDLRNSFYIETGLAEQDLVLETTKVSYLIEKALIDLGRFTENQSDVLRVRISGNRNASISGDFQKLKDAFRCLLYNALLYSTEEITVEIKPESDTVIVQINDLGIGISEADAPMVFKRFFKGQKAAEHNPNGSGLGLFIAKSFIEMSGGSLYFESRENKGTHFTLTLPVARN
ncbi:MAG: hypothetical protein A2293_01140 [Elusimicrobia bacterium RIFOXYB2_FULL_49_7]|nr:MAG: hypothetical protein A2293_01140 [Elusimicrobia bacterium RIFOXYB2_FULL_49_7]